ncbi:MAG: hypothetical protein PUB81_02900 [Clostridiales bacterium]|nr:hypothetical protein [Clostridiales bacterium]
MFLFAELSVEEYVSQMTTLAIIATVLGVIGVCLLIFAFILKDRIAKQAAAADTAEQPESDEALSSETELSAEEEQPAEEFFAEEHYVEESQPQEEFVAETTSEESEEEIEEEPTESPAEEDEEEETEEEEEISPVEEPQPVEINDDSAPFVFGNSKGKRIPFETKVADGNDMTKLAYKTISEFLLSQPKVKCAKAFACERYYIGRKSIAKLTIRGKTLNCYLAIDPTTLDAKYHAQDASNSKKYEKTPAMIRARSPRAIKYCCTLAKQIIDEK